jgi:hypothetical protein
VTLIQSTTTEFLDDNYELYRKTLPQPWTVAMEATIFSGWNSTAGRRFLSLRGFSHELAIYDNLAFGSS